MEYVKAPDFPTGGEIFGLQGVKDAFETGRGRIIIRAKAEIENNGQHDQIVITEIPYGVVKSDLVKSIYQLADEKKNRWNRRCVGHIGPRQNQHCGRHQAGCQR